MLCGNHFLKCQPEVAGKEYSDFCNRSIRLYTPVKWNSLGGNTIEERLKIHTAFQLASPNFYLLLVPIVDNQESRYFSEFESNLDSTDC